MTAIAAYRVDGRVWMGGDAAAVEQSHYNQPTAQPKVFERGPLVMGYTSSFAMGHALQYRLHIPPNLPAAGDLAALDRWMSIEFMDAARQAMREAGYLKSESGRQTGGVFLTGVRGELYVCDNDFVARRNIEPFAACGSGETACLAAMDVLHRLRIHPAFAEEGLHPGEIVEGALQAAAKFVTTVCGPFTVISGGAVDYEPGPPPPPPPYPPPTRTTGN